MTSAPAFRPHVFGKFFLLQRLAVGGMAEIFRAKVVGAGGFEKELVLKRILPERSRDEQFIRMLVNEAKLTVQLTHGNVAQIYECGAVDGVFFIAMELVHGASLKEVMAALPRAGAELPRETAIWLVLQLLQGLDYAHRKTDADGRPLQVVHCDVSPDNALVTWEGEVKLLDFGIARAATGLSNYKEGMLMGKLGYVAPEQASLERAWDHRVDVFAAGVVLYELLTGQKPFPRATDVDSLLVARRAQVIPPSTLDERLPKELDGIVARALAYDPDDRFSDARAFAQALVDVLFPTPHSAIQESLAHQMKAVFADRIAKARAARAHDALVTKVLANTLRSEASAERPLLEDPLPPDAAELAALDAAKARPEPVRPRRSARPIVLGVPTGRALLLAALAAIAGAAGTWTLRDWLATGTVLVTSSPPGARVAVDGVPIPQPTPALVGGLRLRAPHTVVVSAPERRTATLALEPGGAPARTLHAELGPALGVLRVESVPPGAEVRVDGATVGRTPLEIPRIRMDDRHRIDLVLAGYELDQFVVRPADDGATFRRVLRADATVR